MQTTIAELVDEYRQTRDEMEALTTPRKARMDEIKEELLQRLEEAGENFKDDIGYARLVPETETTSYDKDLLDTFAQQYPFLLAARQVKTRKAYISIR